MRMKIPKSKVTSDGRTVVYCPKHKCYLPEEAFYKTSNRKYDSYCKEHRKQIEHNFYNNYVKDNPSYHPTIRRKDNMYKFDERIPKPKKKQPDTITETIEQIEFQHSNLLLPPVSKRFK